MLVSFFLSSVLLLVKKKKKKERNMECWHLKIFKNKFRTTNISTFVIHNTEIIDRWKDAACELHFALAVEQIHRLLGVTRMRLISNSFHRYCMI